MIAIIKGSGNNIASLQFALMRLSCEFVYTDEPEIIQSASHVILPGVGQAKNAMQNLQNTKLDQLIPKLKQPVLGICMGMQLLFESSEESHTHCLSILPGKIRALLPSPSLTVPHMGWNNLQIKQAQHRLFNQIGSQEYVYFVHQYYAPFDDAMTIASCTHGTCFSAIVQKDNFFGMQFHPEKSGTVGSQLLRNFLSL